MSSTGTGRANQIWTQIPSGVEPNDHFGSALATGDFNKDGISDLAIGVPEEEVDTTNFAGAVNVIYGSSSGLSATMSSTGTGRVNQIWTQNSIYVESDSEEGDRFGSALATGDFNKDGISDLAIGAPYENLGAGAVNVIYGSSGGLSSIRLSPGDGRADQIWMQNSTEIEGDPKGGDLFGSALATGDFNKDGISDLAIGVPGEDVGIIQTDAGAVNVISGSLGITIGSGALSATVPLGGFGRSDQLWTQDSPNIEDPNIEDRSEAADRFGSSLG